uniref:Uncharacterized protein n=1 Tax=Marseillevirus sp. TaxID=2809551 RepID=A0AA96ELS1_9VIRU|nr:hypothetical protein MarFTMF_486 [Marseillevirus sp.]
MNSTLYVPQIGHQPSSVCDGSLKHKGNDMYECDCMAVLTSAFGRKRSVDSVLSEIEAVNRAMRDKNKGLEQTHREVRGIMLGR